MSHFRSVDGARYSRLRFVCRINEPNVGCHRPVCETVIAKRFFRTAKQGKEHERADNETPASKFDLDIRGMVRAPFVLGIGVVAIEVVVNIVPVYIRVDAKLVIKPQIGC